MLLFLGLLAGERYREGWGPIDCTVGTGAQSTAISYPSHLCNWSLNHSQAVPLRSSLVGVVIVQPGPFLALFSKLPMYPDGFLSVQGSPPVRATLGRSPPTTTPVTQLGGL